jgi:phosphopantetheine adenylyltransferase
LKKRFVIDFFLHWLFDFDHKTVLLVVFSKINKWIPYNSFSATLCLMASIHDFQKLRDVEVDSMQKLMIGVKLDVRFTDVIMARRMTTIENNEEMIQTLQKRINKNIQQLFIVADTKIRVFNGAI